MALRNIFIDGDDILRKNCREVTEINSRIKILVEDMIETMQSAQGVGIAAPQVGVARRVCVVAPPEKDIITMINPVILSTEGEQEGNEGCLSVPGMVGTVKRPYKIKVQYKDIDGNEIIKELEDFDAVIASHEIDHLDGILYSDKATEMYDLEEE